MDTVSTVIEPLHRNVEVNGLNLHYLEWGDPARTTVVLLHGLRGHAQSWDDVAAALSTDFHVLALDQRGRGLTDWAPDGDYSAAAFVGDLAGFCRVLGLASFVLIGHSMGARNAMAFAETHAHMLEKLVLSEFGPEIDPRGAQRIAQELIDVPEAFDTLDDAIAYMAQFNRYASAQVMRRRELYATRELPDGRIGWRYDREIREARRRGDPVPPLDLWPSLEKIACPTLVVRATETDVLRHEVAERMCAAIADARLVEIDRAEHMVFEDNPEDFIAAVRAFLS